MEILTYIAAALLIALLGFGIARQVDRRYHYSVFSARTMGMAAASVATWALAAGLYRPGTASSALVEVGAGAFVILLGVGLPVGLLVRNVRATNLFWGPLAFIYQLLAVSTVIVLALLVILRLRED